MYEVIDMDHLGRGIVKDNGKVIFVNGALTGDFIDIDIIKEKKNYSEANIKKIVKPSSYRKDTLCKYYGVCGGCDLMHVDYEYQLKYKQAKVINIVNKYSNLLIEPKIIPSDKIFNYRNKITLHPSSIGLGFKKRNSTDVVYIDECLLASDIINDCLKKINSKEEVILRSNDNEVISNVLEKSELIKEINGFKFKIHYNSFFQVNDYICSRLFDLVDSFIDEEDSVLDLYSGVGTLSIVSSKAKIVYGVEINVNAYNNALENVKLNNKDNVFPILGDSKDVVLSFDKYFDTLIVDPPRSGLDSNTISFVLNKMPKKVLYISCDPMSLGRDLNLLKEKYIVKDSYILDMFPNTHHVETVLFLEKK